MIIVYLFSGLIAGTLAGLAFWITDYGIPLSVLAYCITGTAAVIFTALFRLLFSQVARWWWTRSVDFRFYTIFFQSAVIASTGVIFIAYSMANNGGGNAFLTGIVLLLMSPTWLSIALDNILGEPELKLIEDYL